MWAEHRHECMQGITRKRRPEAFRSAYLVITAPKGSGRFAPDIPVMVSLACSCSPRQLGAPCSQLLGAWLLPSTAATAAARALQGHQCELHSNLLLLLLCWHSVLALFACLVVLGKGARVRSRSNMMARPRMAPCKPSHSQPNAEPPSSAQRRSWRVCVSSD